MDAIIDRNGNEPVECYAQNEQNLSSRDDQVIFDDRYNLFMSEFGHTCEKENANTSIAIVVDPQKPNQPYVFMRGHEYEIAKLLAMALRKLKGQILHNLEA